jgi:hypothetical protein
MRDEARETVTVIIGILVIIVVVISGLLYGLPQYRVWQKELKGKADLKEAEWSKQIAIEEAKAELESAKLKAQAEVERAKGVAEANAIIGDSLKGNEAYLRYLWIQGLHDSNTETIYVATETGLPILEAGRLGV